MQNELTPMIQTLITFGTGIISVAVLVLVWKAASAVARWTHTLDALGIDVLRLDKNNTKGHLEIRVAIGHMDEKVDDVGDRVTDLEREVRDSNDSKR